MSVAYDAGGKHREKEEAAADSSEGRYVAARPGASDASGAGAAHSTRLRAHIVAYPPAARIASSASHVAADSRASTNRRRTASKR